MTTDFIYSVEELFTRFLTENSASSFNIPPYQRGYKWNAATVSKLLTDIERFDPQKDPKKFYCLQNLTLVPEDHTYNVVDGQQRLTTLLVILARMGEAELVKDKIKYSIRDITEEFINRYLLDESHWGELGKEWKSFLADNKPTNTNEPGGYDYQDIYYLFQAFKTVDRWYSEKTPEEQKVLKDRLLNRVKLIVNEIYTDEEQKLFGNLNGSRVQLDGADLVRAVIITNVARMSLPDADLSIQQAVQLNETRVKIGMQLDDITRWWKVPDHIAFYAPVYKSVKWEEIPFNESKYPIDGLYKIYALLESEKEIVSLDLFENDIVERWESIQYLQRVLADWFEDRTIYHLMGYVFHQHEQKGQLFKGYYQEWKKGTSRKDFIKRLKADCKTVIDGTQLKLDEKLDLEGCRQENWYEGNDLEKVVILCDILDILDNSMDKRILPPIYFESNNEQKEHIFPQTPNGGKLRNKTEKDKNEITDFFITIIKNDHDDKMRRNLEMKHSLERREMEENGEWESFIKAEIEKEKKEPEYKTWMDGLEEEFSKEKRHWGDRVWEEDHAERLNKRLMEVFPLNSLGNMCLLSESINKRYGNDFYTEKRIEIISASRSEYIRPHVLDAFEKAWLKRDANLSHLTKMTKWECQDVVDRRESIVERINSFFDDEESRNN